jgi:hypothetical protein
LTGGNVAGGRALKPCNLGVFDLKARRNKIIFALSMFPIKEAFKYLGIENYLPL